MTHVLDLGGYSDEEVEEESKADLPWIQKYRPEKLSDVISHKQIMNTLQKFIEKNELPHLLFYGPSGTGKTSTIISCAKELYHDYYKFMVLELNTSDNRGIETVRTQIKSFVNSQTESFLPKDHQRKFKLVILDEIDAMTLDAQAILRQIIESNSRSTRFCLICNYLNKINLALQSRCALFRFIPLKPEDMEGKVTEICVEEGLDYNEKGIKALVKVARGDLRKAINILQSTSLTYEGKITADKIYACSGYCHPKDSEIVYELLMNLLKKKQTIAVTCQKISELIFEKNISLLHLLNDLKNFVLDQEGDDDPSVASSSGLSLRDDYKINVIDKLATLETYIGIGVEQKSLIMYLASIFVLEQK